MQDKIQKTKKKAGRPRLLTDHQLAHLSDLYFERNWTAKRIHDELYPSIGEGTIRMMARRWRSAQDGAA